MRLANGKLTTTDGPFIADDFGKEFTPGLRTQEERLRAQIEQQRKS